MIHFAPKSQSLRACCQVVALAVVVATSAWQNAAETNAPEKNAADERRVSELLEQRQFDEAERYCASVLASDDLSPDREAAVTAQHIRLLAAKAWQSPLEEQASLWKQAGDVAEAFSTEHEKHPRQIVVQTQAALTVVSHADQMRQQAELGLADEDEWQAVRARLREGLDELEFLAGEADRLLRQAYARPARRDTTLSAQELQALQRHIRHQRARAFLIRARAYPPASPDRSIALHEAIGILGPYETLNDGDRLAIAARLDAATAYRLLGRVEEARKRLEQLGSDESAAEFADSIQAESLRLLVATRDWPEVARRLNEATVPPAGEVALARLEALLALREHFLAASDAERAKATEHSAAKLVETLQADGGQYESRYAEALLARAIGGGAAIGSDELLRNAAAGLFNAGRSEEAIEAYDRAAAAAREAGASDRAFEAAYTAAGIVQRAKRHPEARDRMLALARDYPEAEKSSFAHLLGALSQSQLATKSPAEQQRSIELFQQHLEQWPSSETADEAALRLGWIYDHRREWASAVRAYRQIRPSAGQWERGCQLLTHSYEQWLESVPEEKRIVIAREAVEQFDRIASENRTHRLRAMLEKARFQIRPELREYSAAEKLLDELSHLPEAATLRVVALAGQGKLDEAREALRMSAAIPPEELLKLLEMLRRLPSDERQLGLRLHVAERLYNERGRLAARRKHEATRAYALALADAGQTGEAAEKYKALLDERPTDLSIRLEYAEFLSRLEGRHNADAALAAWREVEKRSTPDTPAWFEAKLGQAAAHHRRGADEHALKILRLTAVLHPDLGGETMKAKFEALGATIAGDSKPDTK